MIVFVFFLRGRGKDSFGDDFRADGDVSVEEHFFAFVDEVVSQMEFVFEDVVFWAEEIFDFFFG